MRLLLAFSISTDLFRRTETASMDSTTDTASGIAFVMKDKKNHGMKNKDKRMYNKPSSITYTRTYYGIKQYHNLKKSVYLE